MEKATCFEDLWIWQQARILVKTIYEDFSQGPAKQDYGFCNQIQKAGVSIMNNIAEGYERQTDKEFRQGLYIAKGSCAELRSMITLSKDLKLIDPETANSLEECAVEISKILSGLIRSLSG